MRQALVSWWRTNGRRLSRKGELQRDGTYKLTEVYKDDRTGLTVTITETKGDQDDAADTG